MEIISVICSHRPRVQKIKEKRLLNSHKIASEQSKGRWVRRGREGVLKKRRQHPRRIWPWLSFLLYAAVAAQHPALAARGNHNVCIIYLRFAFKGFKLLFNLVFPSWVTRCDDDDENKNNSNKYANFCAFYWKYCEERKWLTSGNVRRARGVRRRGICWEPLLSVHRIYNEGQVLAIDFASNSPRESIWKCGRILNCCQFKINTIFGWIAKHSYNVSLY